ncbi:hypothetical protein KDU71_22730 [Carboxylicivirga sediminis]|uniref:Uncharacterized protein n=1 Tax=Carboxylicivirga sediminis TaxID=2006564 RepID=A0A941F883_9BACT|nr:hypothetical protein [Carboxylicivirga sediminis]MBR8538402.1 hypothetical protein [Carboxylicivirga sediminis]
MKNVLLILLLVPLNIFSQEYPRVDTLNFGENVKEAFLYQHYCHQGDTNLVEKYIYDDAGNHIYTFEGYNYPMPTRTMFEYEKGLLNKIIKHKYTSSYNDSLKDEMWNRYFKILSKGENKETERKADSLYQAYKLKYVLIDPEKVRWEKEGVFESEIKIEYNSQSNPKEYRIYTSIMNEPPRLDMVLEIEYNDNGRIKSKCWTDIEHPNTIKLNAFKPNTLMLNDSIKVLSGDIRKKEYTYNTNLVLIECFLNQKHTGIEKEIYNPTTRKKDIIVMNLTGDTLSYRTEYFDLKGKLIKKERIIETGYDGFGYGYDSVAEEQKEYYYDSEGRINQILGYEDKKRYSVSTYKY